MKAIRFVLFIPAFFLTLIIGNLLFELLLYVINLFRTIEDTPLSFLWDYFLKSLFLTFIGLTVGLHVYPIKNKLIPLILFSLFYILLPVIILYGYYEYWDEFIGKGGSRKLFASQISLAIGVIIGVGSFWYKCIKDGFENFD